MSSNKVYRFGPLPLTNTLTTNLLNPPTISGGVNAGASACYIVLSHIRVLNKTSVAVPASFWLGATGANAAGTEVIGTGKSVPANSYIDWYGQMRLDVADFLVGGAGSNTALSIQGEGEIGVA